MWDNNQAKVHPLMDNKDTIAHHVVNTQQKVRSSIPNNTFKAGSLPYTIKTLNYNEVAEPTGQPLDQMLSPLEYAGLVNVWHKMPKNVEKSTKPRNYAAGIDHDVVMKGKWKTSNAGKTKPVRFSPYTKTGTDIHTLRGARSNRGANKSILATGPDDAFITSDFRAPRMAKHAIINPATLAAAKKVIVGLYAGRYTDPAVAMADPDVQLLLSSGIDWGAPNLINDIVYQTGISRETYGSAIGMLIPMMRTASSMKKGASGQWESLKGAWNFA